MSHLSLQKYSAEIQLIYRHEFNLFSNNHSIIISLNSILLKLQRSQMLDLKNIISQRFHCKGLSWCFVIYQKWQCFFFFYHQYETPWIQMTFNHLNFLSTLSHQGIIIEEIQTINSQKLFITFAGYRTL